VCEILVYIELQQRTVPEKKEKRQSRKQQVAFFETQVEMEVGWSLNDKQEQ
jgi:hypothetical protein